MISSQRLLFLTKQALKHSPIPFKSTNTSSLYFSLSKHLLSFPFTSSSSDHTLNNPHQSTDKSTESSKTASKEPKEHIPYGFNSINHSNIEDPLDDVAPKPIKKSSPKPRRELKLKEDNPAKTLEQKYFSQYKNAFLRVVLTCNFYLQSSTEERKNVMTSSRFYYVSKELDLLSEKEQADFREYLKLYANRNKIYGQRDLTILLAANKKYGDLLLKLTSHFFDLANHDFSYYLDKEIDEVKIGEMGQRKTSMKDENRILLRNDLDNFHLLHSQISFYAMKAPVTSASDPKLVKILGGTPSNVENKPVIESGKSEKERVIEKGKNLSRSILIKKRTLFVTVCRRIIATMRIYLKSAKEERENITEESRFYYVHKALGGLNEEEQRRFGDFLERFSVLIKKSPFLPLYKNEPRNEGGDYKRRVIIPTYSRKDTVEFLKNEKKFGAILLQVIVEFTRKENVDHGYYLNSESDEVSIGNIGRKRRTTMMSETKDLIMNRMEDFKWYSLGLWYEAEEPEGSTSYTHYVEEY